MGYTEAYEVTKKDILKDRALKHIPWIAPTSLSIIPALIFFIASILTSDPASKVFFLFFALVSFIGGFFLGLVISLITIFYRSRWLSKLRDKIAVDGIKPHEVDWFKNELTGNEKKVLQEMESKDKALADAYREALAARLTATRILKNTKQMLTDIQKRYRKLQLTKTVASTELIQELENDKRRAESLKEKAEKMLNDTQAKLQMIEIAMYRDEKLTDMELNLQKLSLTSSNLPLALEAMKLKNEIRQQLEQDAEKLLE